LRADTARNMLLIQGTGAERRAAVDTVMASMSTGCAGSRWRVPDPQHRAGADVAELEKILDSGEGRPQQNTVKFSRSPA